MSQSATFPGEISDSGIANKSCKYLKLLHFLVKYRSSPQKHPCSTCKRSPHWTGVIVEAIKRFPLIGGNRAIFTDECSPKSPKHCLQCSEQWAIFTDRWKSRDFYRWKSPQIARPFPIPETVTSPFWNIQSNGRFSPIGGNRAIFTDEFPPTLPNHLPSQRLSRISFAMFRAMGAFHRSLEIARFLPMSASPKSPNNLPSQRPSRIAFAMFSAMGDFHRSVEIARFLPMSVPPNRQNIPITKTITDVFCNVQSNGRFSPIGGNHAIFTDEIPQIAKSFPIPETVLKCSKQCGDFHRSVESRDIYRWISTPHCQTICHPKDRHTCLLQCSERWAILTDRWKARHFCRWIFPPNCQTICHPKDRHRFLLGPEIPRPKKNRTEIATDSPPNRQRRAKYGGMGGNRLFWGRGGWGRPTLPRGTSQFCVCTSSAQCSDSFLEDRNLPT